MVEADVCLILEGTYPYVQGGVSSWVHQLIGALPDVRFSLLHLSSTPQELRSPKYELPPNVIGLHELFVHDYREDVLSNGPSARTAAYDQACVWPALERFHSELFADGAQVNFEPIFELIGDDSHRVIGTRELYSARESWDLLTKIYERHAASASFVDYFWTWRFTHVPLFALMRAPVPRARVYHTISTGYAGLLGVIAKLRTGRPLLVTEHGIYTRERAMEIAQAQWIHVQRESEFRVERTRPVLKRWWIEMFRFMSKVTYQHSDRILTITGVNRDAQLRDGADPRKMAVIPNGIRLDRFADLRERRRTGRPGFTVGFVGRVVPIKDLKTLIRAAQILSDVVPDLRVLIVGPTDEDQAYFEDCKRLVSLLDLEDVVTFTGRADVADVYPTLDVLVLTSLSEGQPLVLLEANCAGIPAVATNVGACQELLYGRGPEDRALGPSGIVTPVASPHETAEAVIALWRDADLRSRMADAGVRRVELFYREEAVNEQYRAIYQALRLR